MKKIKIFLPIFAFAIGIAGTFAGALTSEVTTFTPRWFDSSKPVGQKCVQCINQLDDTICNTTFIDEICECQVDMTTTTNARTNVTGDNCQLVYRDLP